MRPEGGKVKTTQGEGLGSRQSGKQAMTLGALREMM